MRERERERRRDKDRRKERDIDRKRLNRDNRKFRSPAKSLDLLVNLNNVVLTWKGSITASIDFGHYHFKENILSDAP